MKHPLSRREFLSASVAAATAAAVGLPGCSLADVVGSADPMAGWKWDKGVCRFCGVGCGIEIATRDKRVVAVRGDAASPVNRGLLCVKGYANAEIPYVAEEHTPLRQVTATVGQRLRLIPSHGCTTNNLHRRLWIVRDGIVEDVWPIEGSGCLE